MVRPRFAKLAPAQQQAILAAALDEFSARGFHDASLNRVIEAAGISKGSMYYYFDGKEDLYAHLLRVELGRLFAGTTFAVPEQTDPGDFWAELESYYLRLLTALEESPQLASLIRGWIGAAGNPELLQAQQAMEREIVPWLEQVLVAGQRIGAIRNDLPSGLLIAVATGMGQAMDTWLLTQQLDATELPAQVTVLVKTIRRALGEPPSPAVVDTVNADRLRSLLEINRSIVAELSLEAVLRRIVESARTITQAQYAALGVNGPNGRLRQFVHVGMDADTVAAIGQLPEGKGVLGAVITDPRPMRVASIAEHPRSAGFPLGHPAMNSFLGVPIRSRGEVFGSLYLANRQGAPEFSAEDEALVVAIAATAGVAIDNARLYEESRRQQAWLRASTEVTRDLLQGTATTTQSLTRIADTVRDLASAVIVSVAFRGADPDTLTVRVARGEGASELLGLTYPFEGSLVSKALATGRGLFLGPDHAGYFVHLRLAFDVGPVMICPLVREGETRAAVLVGRRRDDEPFTEADLRMAEAFANQAAVALELADRRESQRRLEVLEDRARIAHDLHDHTIHRLWAVGLTVQSAAVRTGDPVVRESLQSAVDSLDATIRQIRTTIFELQQASSEETTPRSVLMKVVAEVEPALGFAPEIVFVGPLDTAVQADVLGDAEAVLREGLTNIAKHANADRVRVTVEVSALHMVIQISDNGPAPPTGSRRSGLANLERRARLRGGALVFNHDQEGTTLRWSASLGDLTRGDQTPGVSSLGPTKAVGPSGSEPNDGVGPALRRPDST